MWLATPTEPGPLILGLILGPRSGWAASKAQIYRPFLPPAGTLASAARRPAPPSLTGFLLPLRRAVLGCVIRRRRAAELLGPHRSVRVPCSPTVSGRSTPRLQYLQELVTQFQNATNEELKEKIVANLANFSYDPYNYSFLRQLNVLELFLNCLTEPNEKLVEFGAGGVCNSCVDPENAATRIQCGGIPLIIQCLSSPTRRTVSYAFGALYYLCNSTSRKELLKPEVIKVIRKYAATESVNVNFSNLANAFLDRHPPQQN